MKDDNAQKWPKWVRDDGSVVSCTEKVKVMAENFDELKQLAQDALEDGLLMESPASYSLDDKRQNFHFSTQSARVIRNGALEGYARGVSFQSLTPAFWGRCDGVADDWELHGFLSCAKGEPLQLMRVGHGAAHARFRDVPIEVRA